MKKLSLDELGRVTPEIYKTQEKNPIVIILDNIRSMYNVGSIFRTADAFAV
jgi:tRNA G18 (ribose-2'-O)-methylase SpoU